MSTMIRKNVKLTIPQYRERKEIFEALGYKEISYKEKDFCAYVSLEIDENIPHYEELRRLERSLYRKGPSFYPIILMIVVCFVLLSTFVILLAKEKSNFDLVSNAIGLLLPSFAILLADVLYTYFYFSINRKIIERGHPTKESILESIEQIKSK